MNLGTVDYQVQDLAKFGGRENNVVANKQNAGNIHTSFFQYDVGNKWPSVRSADNSMRGSKDAGMQRTYESMAIARDLPIDISKPRKDWKLFEESETSEPVNMGQIRDEGIRYMITPTALSNMYFSQYNIKQIQNMLRYQVWAKTKHVIDPQDETNLLIIMRSIFLQYCRMQDTNNKKILQAEVDRLNLFVLQDAIPEVLVQIEQYFGYLRDASRVPVPLDRGVSSSSAGTREMRSFMDVMSFNGDEFSPNRL